MLKFQVQGRVAEKRELRTSKDKGDRIWRRLWQVTYEGGAVDVCFGTEAADLLLFNGADVGHEVKVSGHVKSDKMGNTFVYDAHEVVTGEDKAVAALVANGFTEQQARAMLAKAPKGDAKGAA